MNPANRRIALNTVYMYVRLVTLMAMGLYTSRLVLSVLGVSDYGIFAVVGGVMALFTFLSNALANATSRFLNTEMGRGGDVNATFNINLLLHVALALLIFLLAESVGLWYIHSGLNVAPGRLDDALFVFQVSIFTTCLGIVASPFQSLFIAHEQFRFQMVVDIVNSFVRLGCILLLTLYDGSEALRLYSLIFSLTSLNTLGIYYFLGRRRWPEIICLRLVRGWARYREVLVFNNWNLLATLSYMARSSGSDIMLNAFFGTSVNGAFAIAKAVGGYVSEFADKFDSASAPQIVQAYAAGDHGRVSFLVNKIGRANLLLFELMLFPLLIELDFVLGLWLGEVPPFVLELTRINLWLGLVGTSCGGLGPLIRAYGRIKWFQIEQSTCFLLCIPLGIGVLSLGYSAKSLLYLFLVADLVHRSIQLCLLRHLVGFDSLRYVREAYLPPFLIGCIMSVLLLIYSYNPFTAAPLKIIVIISTFLLAVLLVWTLGMQKEERCRFWNGGGKQKS
ncbi:MAG: hypothetical protein PUB53_03410 [Bacteroidales bacterium]|nr:hypothetical protein [Bacteroidales bacterium]